MAPSRGGAVRRSLYVAEVLAARAPDEIPDALLPDAFRRQLYPLPRGLGDLLDRFPKAVTVEMNTGQLSTILRSEFLKDIECISNVSGQPFHVSRLRDEFTNRLEAKAQ